MSSMTSVVGNMVAGVGQLYGAFAQYHAAKYQQRADLLNARQAGYQASETETAGKSQQDMIKLRAGAMIAQATTAEAANNIQVGVGTAGDVLSDIAKGGAVDVAKSQYNTTLTAWGYRTQKTAFESQSRLASNQATISMISGSIGAAAGALGGASQYNTNIMGQPQQTGSDNSMYSVGEFGSGKGGNPVDDYAVNTGEW